MSSLRTDLDIVTNGLAMVINFTVNEPKQDEGGQKSYDDHRKKLKEHNVAFDKWLREEGPVMASAALRAVGSLFINAERIAKALEYTSGIQK